ncbi:MAG: hypothetical protein FJX76_09290 [Armatimonadetes bacterium]|nr:hypothetical protein [Armatimonadota bacterium]
MKRMWDGAKAGSTNGWRCGIEQGRKKGMSAMALAGGLAGAGVCLYYAASLWSESPLITLIFGIPITGLTFTAGATVGRLLGAVLGPVVGAPVGAALGAMKGAYAGLKGDPPPEPCPPPDDANQQP